jgi:hypothetical protein
MKFRFAIAAACFAAAASARAEVPESGLAQFNAAVSEVTALMAQDKATGTMPKFANPAERPALERLCDIKAILGAPPYTAQSLPALQQIIAAVLKLVSAYADSPPGQSHPTEAALQAALSEYQDEMTPMAALVQQATGASVQASADRIAHMTPEERAQRRSQLVQYRNAQRYRLQGLIESFYQAVGVLREDNLLLTANGIRNEGVLAVSAFSLADRDAIAQAARDTLPKLTPAVQVPLKDLIAVMANRDCEGLCTIEAGAADTAGKPAQP